MKKSHNLNASFKTLDRVFDDNFSYFLLQPYVVTPYLNHLEDKTVQIRGHNICFYTELTKINPN